jgi:hypothetical protein
MRKRRFATYLFYSVLMASEITCAQDRPSRNPVAELRLSIASSLPGTHRAVPAVVWLEPISGTPTLPFISHGRYTLLQKNRTFIPHLQVIPVGSVVEFPNADPFFHNVFSLFEGKQFNLGLYEAGSSKAVTFSHRGVSYIFCNIHPEMSAVVLALATPLYAIADANDSFVLRNIPPGNYKLHFWIEGIPQPFLESLSRPMHFSFRVDDLGVLKVPIAHVNGLSHNNMFGDAYTSNPQSTYSVDH